MSKFRVSVHRWITGILASAMVFSSLPVNVFAEEVEATEDYVDSDSFMVDNFDVTFVYDDDAVTVSDIELTDKKKTVESGDIVSFKAAAKEGYKIVSVENATLEGDTYKTAAISAATTITITSAALESKNVAFETTGITEISYTVSGGDVKAWTAGSEPISVVEDSTLVLTGFTANTGYDASAVTVKVGETAIEKAENVWTIGKITENTNVSVEAALKPAVTVSTKINTYDYKSDAAKALATVTTSGLDDDGKTKAEKVSFTINVATGKEITSATYMIGTNTPLNLVNSGNVYEIPAEDVFIAMDQGKGISVAIEVEDAVERVYETKLGLNKKTTSFIAGEGVVAGSTIDINDPETYKDTLLLAKAKFSSKTTVKKLSKAEVISPEGYICLDSNGGLLIVDDEIRMYSSNYLITPGKYTLKVYAASPDGRDTKSDPATLALTVKRPIEDLELKNVPSKVYKASDKAVMIKPTVTYNLGEKYFEPAVKKVTWEILNKDGNVPTSEDHIYGKVSVKNGTVTIAKDYQVSRTATDNQFIIRAKAADFDKNSTYGETLVEIVGTRTEIGSIQIGTVTDFGGELKSSDLLKKEIIVKDKEGKVIDPYDVTVTSSDSKNFAVGRTYYYDPEKDEYLEYDHAVTKINKAGKFTITVTAKDGGKSTIKQTVKIKAATPSSYSVKARAYHDYYSNYESIIFNEKVATLNEYPTKIQVLSEAGSTEDSVLVNNATLSVKGGKKLSDGSNAKGLKWIYIKPTSDKITITHKYGKGADAKSETYTINLNHSQISASAAKKTYDRWADAYSQEYSLEFNVSGIDETNAGEYCMRYNYPDKYSSKQSYIYWRLINDLNSADAVNLTKDQTKFTVKPIIGDFDMIPKGTYSLSAALYKATVTEDGTVYKAVSDPFVVTFKSSKAKAPSVALSVTDKKPVEVGKTAGNTAVIGFKTYKNVKGIYNYSVVTYCNNKDGKVNRFTDFFEVVPVVINGNEIKEPGINELSNGLQLKVKKIDGIDETKDLNGWVKYEAVGEDGTQTVEKIEKITVKFK